MVLIKNKKGQVIKSVVMWMFATFFYFVIGYTMVKAIVESIFLSQNPTGLMYFFGAIVPIVPVIGLMYWGYTILTPEQSQDMGGGLQ